MRDLGVTLRVWLLAIALCASLAAQAQRLPQPSPPGGDASAATELATSTWTRAQLDAWWGALRRHAVTGGARLDVPAELLPPERRLPGMHSACRTCAGDPAPR